MQLPSELSITEEDWNHTPLAVQAAILALWKQSQVLQGQVVELRKEVALLREQVGRHSQNSSQPPSSDGPGAPARPKQTPSGRKAGGQKGHIGHGRTLLHPLEGRAARSRGWASPSERVKQVVKFKPTNCTACGALLLGEDAQPVRHQVSELPRMEPDVTEYQQHTLTCLACGTQNTAEWPWPLGRATCGHTSEQFRSAHASRDWLPDRAHGSQPA